MDVEVRLFAGLRANRFKSKVISLPDGATLGELVRQLGIPQQDVSLPLVNGQYSKMDRPLSADDVASLFPAVAGG
ncbi:MAG TPA: MoaD/ThiS family protein [Phycisphaerae bacterium]|nr:MoaD/ThiS family protein [Phycisphaerae bacterium]